MNKNYSSYVWIAASFLLVIALFSIDYSTELQIKDISVQKSHQKRNLAVSRLPFKTNYIGSYVVNFNLLMDGVGEINIVPDDEIINLSVDGKVISLEEFSRRELRDYERGFDIEINPSNLKGWGAVRITLENSSNPTGLDVRPSRNIAYTKAAFAFFILVMFAYCLSRLIPIGKLQLFIVIVSIGLSIIYLTKTPSNTRTFDVYEGGGHRDYINYIIEQRELPSPGSGWEYHQPPLYYLSAALLKSTFNPGLNDTWAQMLALWYWVIFLVSSMGAVFVVLKRNGIALFLASLAIGLWPSGIIHSIRIGNDVPLYAFYALSFYYCVRCWNDEFKSRKLFLWSLVWASCALLTKSNGLAIWAVIGTLILLHSFIPHGFREVKVGVKRFVMLTGIYSGFLVASLLINLSDNIYEYVKGDSSDWLLSNVSTTINPGLEVENSLSNYLIFDFQTYFTYPFISTWDDKYGRQYFWNFLSRSSLSSEFFFDGKLFALWGQANGVLLFLFFVCLMTILVLAISKRPSFRVLAMSKFTPWFLSMLFLILLLLAYRIKVPLSCNTDFRYIYPFLSSFITGGFLVWLKPGQYALKVMSLSAVAIAILSIPWVLIL